MATTINTQMGENILIYVQTLSLSYYSHVAHAQNCNYKTIDLRTLAI